MRKIIGISGNLKFDEGGIFPGYARAYVNNDYVRSVECAGGVPLILPIVKPDKEIVQAQLQHLDALIISGGYDVNPMLYGEEPHKLLGETLSARDDYDLMLIQEARKLNLPILGICRGLQILNVAAGGTLYQDCSEAENAFVPHWQRQNPRQVTHSVTIQPASELHKIFGDSVQVNSFHHMAVKRLAKGYRATAHSNDGIIEGIESTEGSWVLAVQWHPEMMSADSKEMVQLFELLTAKTN